MIRPRDPLNTATRRQLRQLYKEVTPQVIVVLAGRPRRKVVIRIVVPCPTRPLNAITARTRLLD